MTRCIVYGPGEGPRDTRVMLGYIYIMYEVSDPVVTWLRSHLGRWTFSTGSNPNQPACRIIRVYAKAGTDQKSESAVLKAEINRAFPDHPWQSCWLDFAS